MHFNFEAYERACIFVQATLTITSIQFLYICVEIIIRKRYINEVASLMFLGYAFYDFFIIAFYFMILVNYGIETNDTDF